MRISSFLTKIASGVSNHIYPSSCPSCGTATDNLETSPFCRRCWAGIRRHSGPSCSVCGERFASEYALVCSSCISSPPMFSSAFSWGNYEGTLAEAIHAFKFGGLKRLGNPLASLMLELVPDDIDLMVAVPLSRRALKARGFNQSLVLAGHLSAKSRIPLALDDLLKHLDTKPQVGLSAAQRRENVKGAFKARRRFDGLKILLIDDVMTTGASARECSLELRRAGASDIKVLTLARA